MKFRKISHKMASTLQNNFKMQNFQFLTESRWKMRACGTGRIFAEYIINDVLPFAYHRDGFVLVYLTRKIAIPIVETE
jgi:hypothetical protein